MPVAADPAAELQTSFLKLGAGAPLRELARNRKQACILVCDITRPVPHGKLLPPLIDELTAAGMSKENILILVATGLHRPNEGAELHEVIGSEAVSKKRGSPTTSLGTARLTPTWEKTPSGIPIRVDRRFVEADLRIVVGLVEPHFMAGYSGGRKLVIPESLTATPSSSCTRASFSTTPRPPTP